MSLGKMAESETSAEGTFMHRRSSSAVVQSNSLPSTPIQHARDRALGTSTPPPTGRGRAGSHSPRSRNTALVKPMPSLTNVSPNCRFMSTQTSRRRIPYSIGSDPLDQEFCPPKEKLEAHEEQKLNSELEALFQILEPSQENLAQRERMITKLRHLLDEELPDKNVQVSMFGSSGNLLWTRKSDG